MITLPKQKTTKTKFNFEEISEKLGVQILNPDLFVEAFTHSSYANLHKTKSYERLEYLGDSVLSLIVTDYLYHHMKSQEGELTKVRSSIICEESLSSVAQRLGFSQYILALDTMQYQISKTNSALCDVFESVLGAIYLSLGYDIAKKYALEKLAENIELSLKGQLFHDYKTALQEKVQSYGGSVSYEVLSEKGIPHNKEFVVICLVDGKKQGRGSGANKKAAEQASAKQTLLDLYGG